MNQISVIQYSTSWCPPCKMAKGKFELLKNDYEFDYEFYDLEEKGPDDLSKELDIKGVPVIVFKANGIVRVVMKGYGNVEAVLKDLMHKKFEDEEE